jgi:hypothetical protein
MKSRAALEMVCSLLFPLLFLACAIMFYANGDITEWIKGHQISRLLWLIDFCAVVSFALMLALTLTRNRLIQREQEAYQIREAHREQMEIMVNRATELEDENASLRNRLTELEETAERKETAFEQEALRLTEQAFRALQGQTEAHARHLDAVNLALQHHRAEIAQIRHGLRSLHSAGHDTPFKAHLTPEELQAILNDEPLRLSEPEPRVPDTAPPKPPKTEPEPMEKQKEEIPVVSLAEIQPQHLSETAPAPVAPPLDSLLPNHLPAFVLQSEDETSVRSVREAMAQESLPFLKTSAGSAE